MERSVSRPRSGLVVVALCFMTIVADGYDLIVYGATVPSMLEEPGWNLTHSGAGLIGSWTLFGMVIGFLLAGQLTDRFGRRNIVMFGVLWFSVGSALCGLAPSPEAFGAIRFFAGIGLGGVVPSAVALTVEYAPRDRRQLYNGLMLTGYSFGGIVSALAAMSLLPDQDWRLMYFIAGLCALILPVMYIALPESVNYLVVRGRLDEAREIAGRYRLDFESILGEHRAGEAEAAARGQQGRQGYRLLMSPYLRLSVALFVLTTFCAYIVNYGLATWLPELMRAAGYPLGSSLQFLLVLQVGAIAGMVGGALLADRLGPKRVVIPFFLIAGISLALLSQEQGSVMLMLCVAGAGLGTIGTTVLVYGYIATHFPASCRGTAVGASIGIGRTGAIVGPFLGGWLLDSGAPMEWNFYAFAIPAALAALFAASVPTLKAERLGAVCPHPSEVSA